MIGKRRVTCLIGLGKLYQEMAAFYVGSRALPTNYLSFIPYIGDLLLLVITCNFCFSLP